MTNLPDPIPPRAVSHSGAHEAWVEAIHKEVSILDDTLHHLFGKLTGVTADLPRPERQCDAAPSDLFGNSPLARSLTGLRDRIRNIQQNVSIATSTLEI